MRIYFTWTYDYNVNDSNSRYTIGNNFFKKFPHLEWILTLEEFAVPDDKVKEFSPGKQWNYRLGYFEADDETLAMFNTSVQDILNRGKAVYSFHDVQQLTDEEAYDWVKRWSILEEVEPRKFLVREETEFMGEKHPAVFLQF